MSSRTPDPSVSPPGLAVIAPASHSDLLPGESFRSERARSGYEVTSEPRYQSIPLRDSLGEMPLVHGDLPWATASGPEAKAGRSQKPPLRWSQRSRLTDAGREVRDEILRAKVARGLAKRRAVAGPSPARPAVCLEQNTE
jgi:hypothetical protein